MSVDETNVMAWKRNKRPSSNKEDIEMLKEEWAAIRRDATEIINSTVTEEFRQLCERQSSTVKGAVPPQAERIAEAHLRYAGPHQTGRLPLRHSSPRRVCPADR